MALASTLRNVSEKVHYLENKQKKGNKIRVERKWKNNAENQ